ncbi:MAG: response regulator [bacterium]|nr:response regulator [bacterium]
MPRILIVEDNEMNRDLLVRRLTRRGFEVTTAALGREALERLGGDRPDCILMDLSLPEMDGLEVTRIIRTTPDGGTVPIIALTAHAQASDRERALAAGCDDFDTKPIDLDRLLEKIRALLPADAE